MATRRRDGVPRMEKLSRKEAGINATLVLEK